MSNELIKPDEITQAVHDRYADIAAKFTPEQGASCCAPADSGASCCAPSAEATAETEFFKDIYSSDLSELPVEVTGLSLGCGDPITLANLEKGQTVLDLGSGGGIDCFLAAKEVGPEGFVIGVDMTDEMLSKAEANKAKVGATNVDFRKGLIEDLPVDDAAVDVIVSNCVINLSADKPAVFQEAFRVLKPGGRLAISDMVRQGEMSAEERAHMISWTGCIAGAEKVSYYVEELRQVGFSDISIRDRDNSDVELADSIYPAGSKARVFSARITAIK